MASKHLQNKENLIANTTKNKYMCKISSSSHTHLEIHKDSSGDKQVVGCKT